MSVVVLTPGLSAEQKQAMTDALSGSTADVLIAPRRDDPALPNPWMRFPPAIAALVADPTEWGAIAMRSVTPVDSDTVWKLVAEAAARASLKIARPIDFPTAPRLLSLAPRERPLPAWKHEAIARSISLIQNVRSKADVAALQAGILQCGDHLTPSHEQAQEIEGHGVRHAGDFWHAINHRREPDYGNAKYWIRRVGKHSLHEALAGVVAAIADEFPEGVKSRGLSLIEHGAFDPFRFIDLVSEACDGGDPELIRFAERVQWVEMVGLMECTASDVLAT